MNKLGRPAAGPRDAAHPQGRPPPTYHQERWTTQRDARSRGPPAVAPTIRTGQGPYESSELGYQRKSFQRGLRESGATSTLPHRQPAREREEGAMGKAFPYPWPGSEPCPERAVGRSIGRFRAPMSGPPWVHRFRYGPTPRPPSCFRLRELLLRVLVLAA